MGKTLSRIQRLRDRDDGTVVPTEYARAPAYRNPPGAVALKLLIEMMHHAGSDMGDPSKWHELPLAHLRQFAGVSRLSAQEADGHLADLVAYQVGYWIYDIQKKTTRVRRGVVVHDAEITFPGKAEPDEPNAPKVVRWLFGHTFCEVAQNSDFWTSIDRSVVRILRSRYAIALYQHICSLAGLKNPSIRHTVQELREILGVPPGRLTAFKDLNGQALKPALREINAHSRWVVTPTFVKRQRSVVAVELTWTARAGPDVPPAIGAGPAPVDIGSFPTAGGIHDSAWGAIARELAPEYPVDKVADDYRSWCASSGIPLDKRGGERRFRTFCAGYADNQSKPRKQAGREAGYGYDGPSQEEVDRIEAIKREVDARFAS
ncbi:MAG: replication initiation protein [Rhodospirillales bacterium]|nr:replication initiation protein [Rhodospirillales bacterium]